MCDAGVRGGVAAGIAGVVGVVCQAAAGLDPRAVEIMKEEGVDISGQSSKPIDPGLLRSMDLVRDEIRQLAGQLLKEVES